MSDRELEAWMCWCVTKDRRYLADYYAAKAAREMLLPTNVPFVAGSY